MGFQAIPGSCVLGFVTLTIFHTQFKFTGSFIMLESKYLYGGWLQILHMT